MSETDDEDLRALYQDLILDHSKHPRHFHAIEKADCEAVGHNPLCGDKLVLYVRVGDEGRIAEASFQGDGCAISVASASLMTDMLQGKTAAEARALWEYFQALMLGTAFADEKKAALNPDDVDRLSALAGVQRYPVRVKCATLAWRTLEAALDPAAMKKVGTE